MQTAERLEQYERITGREAEDFLSRAVKLVQENAKKAALMAADNLMERFQEKGRFFQAWGELGAKDNYRLIIDCLLNMPLLFWASEVTGDPKYREKATAHILTAMNCVIRPDHSTYHTYFFDPETGEPVKGVTHQGNRDEIGRASCRERV